MGKTRRRSFRQQLADMKRGTTDPRHLAAIAFLAHIAKKHGITSADGIVCPYVRALFDAHEQALRVKPNTR